MSFWVGKRVLITGITGFKGSWLASYLIEKGADISGYALTPDTNPSLFHLLHLSKRTNTLIDDIRNRENLSNFTLQTDPEIIFHLAAQPLVRQSYFDPIYTFDTNVMGTVNILDSARNLKNLKALVNITTDKVYENLELGHPFKETDRLGGDDPYSCSKACSELVTHSYRKSFFSNNDDPHIITARAGNVIGGGDWSKDRLIPDIIRAYQTKTQLKIRNIQSVRPWQHVLESVDGYVKLAEYLATTNKPISQSWNFGPESKEFAKVGDVLDIIMTKFPHVLSDYALEKSNLHEANLLRLDNSLSRNHLNWSGVWDFEKSVSKTIEWYSSFINGEDPIALTNSQIKEFLR